MNRRVFVIPAALALVVGCANTPAGSTRPSVGASVPSVGASAPSAGAASASAAGSGGATGGQHLGASEKEYSITMTATTASAGMTTFDVKNDGTLVHEFVVVSTDLAADKLPQASGEAVEEQLTSLGEVEDVEPGTSKSFSVDLAPGHYVVLCNIVGHYPAGMHQDLTVQ